MRGIYTVNNIRLVSPQHISYRVEIVPLSLFVLGLAFPERPHPQTSIVHSHLPASCTHYHYHEIERRFLIGYYPLFGLPP